MFVVEPTASEEKLRELLREAHESEELDYKSTLDLNEHHDLIELVKDLAAMRGQPLGGYIVVGADDAGRPTDGLSEPTKARLFDESILRAKVEKYLTEPLDLRAGVHEVDGHVLALVFIGPARRGFEVLRIEGVHNKVVFQAGDVFVRRGTASKRWNGMEADERLARYATSQRETWRREFREDLRETWGSAEVGQLVSRAPAAVFTWQLDAESFQQAAVELLRSGDDITLRRFLLRLPSEVAKARSEGRAADGATMLDRLAALAAIAVEHQRPGWLDESVDAMMRTYELGFDSFGIAQPENHENVELWLGLLSRGYGVGALSVRLGRWWAIPALATPRPGVRDFDTYWSSWIRHAQVQGSRAQMLNKQSGVIPLAHNEVRRLDVLRPDTVDEDETVLASLCQFDVLAAVSVAAARGKIDPAGYYPNFAPYWTRRSMPAFELLVRNPDARKTIAGDISDENLAVLLQFISETASNEALMFNGFGGIQSDAVSEFLSAHLPANYLPGQRGWNLD